ncbi:hypothetical protein [Pseudophaeobacter sp.]|jgi:hypothetical protein|uniref:hypothetical protein n=1 Tax=Pseudophaeobacter sp. TaxID=1971739 RepID=UPI0032D8CC89
MSLVREWRLAKKRYDAAHTQAQKQIQGLNTKLSAVEYYLHALRDDKLSDQAHMRKIDAYLDEFSPDSIETIQAALFRELENLTAIECRPEAGIERTLAALEQILEAAEELMAKGEVSAAQWSQYREVYDRSAHRLMDAGDVFEEFINKRANMEEKLALRLDHATLLKKITQRSRAVHDYLQRNEIPG